MIKVLHCREFSIGVESIISRTQFRTFKLVLLSLQACSTCWRCSFVAVFWLWNMSRHAFKISQSFTTKSHYIQPVMCYIDWLNQILLTCRHSDVLALPQQLSPFSWRSKQSNNVCSSLRRQLDNVSGLLIDVAHVFWHFTVIASGQHDRPDHWAPRFTAKPMYKLIGFITIMRWKCVQFFVCRATITYNVS